MAEGEKKGKKLILVVDDDKTQLALVNAILKTEYDLVAVASGRGALESLSSGTVPDLVILDVLMPEMDGFETYARLRAVDSMRNVPIVFLTAVNSRDEIQKALRMGAADYITKPYVRENFANRIRNAIEVYERKSGRQAQDSRRKRYP